MKVSDEDLTIVCELLAGITTGDRTRLLGDAVVEEIRALRKVAEAAKYVAKRNNDLQISYDGSRGLREALKEAGYDV